MKQQMLKERVELLAIAEVLGYPRMGFGGVNGRKWSVRAGQGEWEKFCGHGHVTRIVTVLRNARILRDNGVVPYNPRSSVTNKKGEWSLSGVQPGEAIEGPPEPRYPAAADLLDEIDVPPSAKRDGERDTWVKAGSVKVYPPGKRRKYPVRKNKAKGASDA